MFNIGLFGGIQPGELAINVIAVAVGIIAIILVLKLRASLESPKNCGRSKGEKNRQEKGRYRIV